MELKEFSSTAARLTTFLAGATDDPQFKYACSTITSAAIEQQELLTSSCLIFRNMSSSIMILTRTFFLNLTGRMVFKTDFATLNVVNVFVALYEPTKFLKWRVTWPGGTTTALVIP
jgi:hypothetical protein